MPDFLDRKSGITWRSPKGQVFNLKTTESGYKRKHNGEVKANPTNTKKSTKKSVTDSNDTFSDLGIAGRDVTLECLFIGDSHDAESKVFTDALCETGKSHLKLAYGDEFTVNVLDFEVKNNLLKAINATTVIVNFHETAKTTYPESESGNKKSIKNAAAKTKATAAQNLTDAVNNVSGNTSRFSKFSAAYSKMMNNVSAALTTANNASLNSIMTDIMGQSLAANALTMTSQLQIVMSKAASLAAKTKNLDSAFSLGSPYSSITDSWKSLISSLITSSTPQSGATDGLKTTEIDVLLINDVAAVSAISSVCESAIDAIFETRKEAVEIAKNLIELEETWTEFIEQQSEKITELTDAFIRDTGIVELVSAAAGEVLKQSYELKVEKTIILSEDKTLIEIAYENYPDNFKEDPDGTIDYLRKSNDFTDDEFFLINKGREIKIYV